ncbi:MAG: hypothetical protein COW84_02775 [Gammaproteobacteria bacterium CG22_combo_CG10-13_8_21_14_all_40_8]|nr:MAG: hypothetical protein COW84_02775 [Gammaproteobacteria bacterium CG22_combo_CG10-13_8_21_14_all_40_8]
MPKYWLYLLIILNLGIYLGQKTLGSSNKAPKRAKIALSLNSEAIQIVKATEQNIELQIENSKDAAVALEKSTIEDTMLFATENTKLMDTSTVNPPETDKASHPETPRETHATPRLDTEENLNESGKDGVSEEIEQSLNDVADKEEDKVVAQPVTKLLEDKANQALVSNEIITPEVPDSLTVNRSCYEWSALEDEELLHLTQKLEASAQGYQVEDIPVEASDGYMVLLGPFSSNEISLEKYKILKQAKIDSFMVNQGKWNHGISLGIFSLRENAIAHQEKIQKKIPNEPIHVENRTREKTVHNVKMEWTESEIGLNSELFLTVFAQNEQKMKKIAKKSCKEIEFLFLRH